jgi:hypothetical protein
MDGMQRPEAPQQPQAEGAPQEGGGENKFVALVGGVHTALGKIQELLQETGKVPEPLLAKLDEIRQQYQQVVLEINKAVGGGGGGAPEPEPPGGPVPMEGGPGGVPHRF